MDGRYRAAIVRMGRVRHQPSTTVHAVLLSYEVLHCSRLSDAYTSSKPFVRRCWLCIMQGYHLRCNAMLDSC